MTQLLGYLAEGLKYVMIFCDNIAHQHYWISLLLFALIVKLVLLPFGIKQQKNSQKAALLRPKEEAIKRKYKDKTDQESKRKMQEEIMAMYRENKYSQFGGCLPLFLQMPILFSLYYIIQNPLHYVCQFGREQIEVIMETFNRITNYASGNVGNITIKAVSELGNSDFLTKLINALPKDGTVPGGQGTFPEFISSLTEKLQNTSYPNYKMFGFVDLSVTPSEQIWPYIFVPIVTFVILLITQKLQKKFTYQPAAADAQQNGATMKIMEYMMPLISAVFAFSLPSALALYWIYQTVLGFGQQVLLAKIMPTHKMTDAEVKEAMREADRQVYEAKKAEEKRKKAAAEEEKAISSSADTKTGVPAGWVEPMGPSSVKKTDAPAPKKGKKNSSIEKADIKNDKKDDE